LILDERKKTAIGGEAIAAGGDEVLGRRDEIINKQMGVIANDLVRCRAAYDPVLNRERPCRRIGDVSIDSRKLCFQHHDTDAGSVNGLATIFDGH